jgi:hypothetical protein
VQAKRWQRGNSVGRPDVQGFFGALAGKRARKGVFITTSSFSREANEFAASVSDSIVLVDGSRLAELMIDHGVGVSVTRTLRIVGSTATSSTKAEARDARARGAPQERNFDADIHLLPFRHGPPGCPLGPVRRPHRRRRGDARQSSIIRSMTRCV